MKFWDRFPSKEQLLSNASDKSDFEPLNVNAHLHSPFSFSAFNSVEQAIELASSQSIKVAGINDFYTVDGYLSWVDSCMKYRIFPLFNIEFIGLSYSEQIKNIRINDPENPGRIYLSGKGLRYPFLLDEPWLKEFSVLKEKSNNHVKLMCAALNQHLKSVQVDFQLDYDSILNTQTKGMIRERHLAKALREKIYELSKTTPGRKELLVKILKDYELHSDPDKPSAIENEIRAVLLKSGGAAFIPENPDSFLSLETIKNIILHAGGIPTYPLLADDKNGKFTDFEENKEMLAEELRTKGIFSVEFISIRNSNKVLEEYASFFENKGFLVSLGSEHNTPDLLPLKLYTRDRNDLSEILKRINYRGACTIAAHQFLNVTEGNGYLKEDGTPLSDEREDFITLGNRLIQNFISS